MIFNKNKHIVLFYTSDYSGCKGVMRFSTFTNHKIFGDMLSYDYFYEILFGDDCREGDNISKACIKQMFKNNEFNSEMFKILKRIIKKKHPNDIWSVPNKDGEYMVLKIDHRLDNYFDDNLYDKYYVARNPLITYIMSESTGEFNTRDKNIYLNLLKSFEMKKELVKDKIIYYENILEENNFKNFTDIDLKFIDLKYYNEAVEFLNDNNIKFNYISKEELQYEINTLRGK